MKERNFSMGLLPCASFGMAFCCVVFLLAGCAGEGDGGMPENDGRVALDVSSGIDVQACAHDDTWEADDAIGICMLNGETAEAVNRKYTTIPATREGDFTAADGHTIYFPTDGSTRNFIGYYPYRVLPEDYIYVVDVSTQTVQKEIDLMGSDRVTDRTKKNPAVQFTFRHKLVKLYLAIQPDGTSLSAGDMEGLTVSITGQKTGAVYDVVKGGDVTVNAEENAGQTIVLLTDAQGAQSEGIVLPAGTTENMQFVFRLKNGLVFTWNIHKAPRSQQFAAGSKYVYTVTIGRTALKVTSSVTDWTPGNGSGETGNAK